MKKKTIVRWLVVGVLPCLFALGCDKDGGEGGESPEAVGQTNESPEVAAPTGGEALGNQVAEIHRSVLEQLRPIVEARPTIDELRPQLAAMREATIQQLVPIGRQIAELDAAEIRAAQEPIRRMGREYFSGADFAWYQEASNHYMAQDFNFAMQELGAINTITQYAFFQLLCSQEAEEAARLNITCE